jgi:adenylate cyclase class 2
MRELRYKDFTLKANVTNILALESILVEAGAEYLGLDRQTDTYFKTARGKLKLRQGTIENLITHYERIEEGAVEKTVVYRYDKNPEEGAIADLFEKQEIIGIVEKERKIFFLGTTKILLDTMPDGNSYVEIEAIDTSNALDDSELRAQCMKLKLILGLHDDDLVKTGYL